MTLKATPLNSAHRAANAKMVDFGGWDMPVNYGSQIEEHNAVRSDAGMFDVSHMCVVDVKGANVRTFLRGLLANNVDKLQVPGKALYSCMLNPEGGVIDDLIVYFLSEEWFRIVVNAGTAEKDVAWMNQQNTATNSGVTITARRDGNDPIALIAVQGPNARAKVWQVLPTTQAPSENLKPFNAVIVPDTAFGEAMIARTGYTGEDGFEIGVPASQAEALWNAFVAVGIKPAGLGARDTLRLEAGMNLYGQDIHQNVSPLAANMAWSIAWEPAERDFIGRAALEAELAAGVQFKLVGLVLEERGVLRAHQVVRIANVGEGEITSGSFSPTLSKSIALARVPTATADRAEVEIRGKWYPVRVVKPTFVRHGKTLI